MDNSKCRIAIACTTYNHEKFIERTLDSFLMQELDEPFEVHVCDDASTDNTAKILRDYEAKYPDIIKPKIQKTNLWQKGLATSKYILFPSIKAEYVALCEGDDYFTDPKKLQKQVRFLDENPDFSICFHPVKIISDDGTPESIFPTLEKKDHYTFIDLLKQNFIQTNSCMYRWRFVKDSPKDLIPNNILPCDYFWHLLHAELGKIGMLSDAMSVYNKHCQGMWYKKDDAWYLNYALLHINFYKEIEKRYKRILTGQTYLKTKVSLAHLFLTTACGHNRGDLIAAFLKNYPELILPVYNEVKNINDKASQETAAILARFV